MATDAKTTKVITGKVRFSYCHVWEPSAIEEGQDKKYSVSIIIPKKDKATLAKINEVVEALKVEFKTKNGGKLPIKFKTPLRDGDEDRPDDEAYANAFFLNASSKTRPGIVDESASAIMDQDEFYSGCYGRASLNFYSYNKAGNVGVACGLNNLQKLQDGERLGGGRSSAEADFGSDADDLM